MFIFSTRRRMPIHTRAVMDFNFGSSPHMSDSCNILINFQNTGTAAVEWYVDSANLNGFSLWSGWPKTKWKSSEKWQKFNSFASVKDQVLYLFSGLRFIEEILQSLSVALRWWEFPLFGQSGFYAYRNLQEKAVIGSPRTGFSKNSVSHLCGYCGEAVDSVISVFTQLQRICFTLEFETLYVSIWQVVADLWQRKGKRNGFFKTALLLFSRNIKMK